MTRYLAILGAALAGAAMLVALSNPLAGAVEEETVPIYFSANIGEEATAKIDGNQIGTKNKITVGENPPLTCEAIEYNGEAVTPGPVSARVRITPQYKTCHVIHSLLGTRTTTVAMNGCAYEITAAETVTENEEGHFVGETAITCPVGKEIEILVYNTSNPVHTGASTLCTIKIAPQSNLTGMTLTSSGEDVVADFNIKTIVASASGLCSGGMVTYEGEATLRATNAASEFVQANPDNKKKLVFDEKPVAKGEKGEILLGTEKFTVKCTSVEYKAEPGARSMTEISFKPTYASCTAFSGKNEVQIKPEGCQYKLKFNKNIEFPMPRKAQTPSSFEVVCGAGESVKVTVTKENDKVNAECSLVIPAQKPVDTVRFKNNFSLDSKLKVDTFFLIHNVTGLNYEVKTNPMKCGKNELLKDGEITAGTVTEEFLITATNAANGNEINAVILGTQAP